MKTRKSGPCIFVLATITIVFGIGQLFITEGQVMGADSESNRPDMSWYYESLKTQDQRIRWWAEARFGCFMHWGVYSYLAGEWKGRERWGSYSEHIQRQAKIDQATYRREVVEKFNPTSFDADQWIRTIKAAGMRYLVITAKHHDGFAMYDSDVSEYNIVKATPFKRDPMRELKEACDRHNIRFGFYYSHAFDWGEKDGAGNDWEFNNPGGDKLLGGRNWWENRPQDLPRIVKNYVDAKSIAQIQELIRKYDPDIMWFDTPHKLPFEQNLRIMKATRLAKPDIVINGRLLRNGSRNYGDYVNTTDKPDEFRPQDGYWEAIPTTNESYGYHKNDLSHKPASHFIKLLPKAVARGGNLLMNIGPRGDGRLDDKDVNILQGIGRWMQINGESIHSAGRTVLPVQAWGESTRKDNTLYLHVFEWPRDGKLIVGGLRSEVKRAYLLSDKRNRALKVRRLNPLDIRIDVPATAPDPVNSVVVAECEGNIETDSSRLLSTRDIANTLRVFDAQLKGSRIRFSSGKKKQDYVYGWPGQSEEVCWPVRLDESASFEAAVSYIADKDSAGGTFEVKIGEQVLSGVVQEGDNESVSLGLVSLSPGRYDIRVCPERIKGRELMRLRSIEMTALSLNGR